MACLTSTCPATNPNPNTLRTQLQVSYTPKQTYECENDVSGSGSATFSPTFLLDGTGDCASSPFDFLSLVAGPRENQRMVDTECQLAVYPQAECGGVAKMVGLVDGAEECHFVGGRSARLVCDVENGVGGQSSASLLAEIQALCSATNTTSGTAIPPAFSGTAYVGFSTTSVGNTTTSPTTSAPFGHATPETTWTTTRYDNVTATTIIADGPAATTSPLMFTTAITTASASKTKTAEPPAPYTGTAAVLHGWGVVPALSMVLVGAVFAIL